MKSVGTIIHSYFLGRRRGAQNASRVVYVSARGKLNAYKGDIPVHVAQTRSPHAYNKALAIGHVRAMLTEAMIRGELDQEQGNVMLNWFSQLRGGGRKKTQFKCDDVADAFLQAANWCIQKTGWRRPPLVAAKPIMAIAEEPVKVEVEVEEATTAFSFDLPAPVPLPPPASAFAFSF